MEKKLSRLAFLTYMFFNNYLLFAYLLIPMMIENLGTASILVPIIGIALTIVLVLFLPKKMNAIPFFERLQKSYFAKVAYFVLLIISIYITFVISVYVLTNLFFYSIDFAIFLVAILVVSLIVSFNQTSVIMNSACFLFIVGIILLILPMFFASEIKDFTLLKPFIIKFDWKIIGLMTFFIFDSISLLMNSQTLNKTVKKLHFILTISAIFLCFFVELADVIILAGVDYLAKNEFLGFFTLYIQDTINYLGNVGFIYVYLIPLIGCFKLGYSIRQLKSIWPIQKPILFYAVLAIVLFLSGYLSILYLNIPIIIKNLVWVMIGALGVLYLFIILNWSDRYEVRF